MKKIILALILGIALIFSAGASNIINATDSGSAEFVDVIVTFNRTPGEAEQEIFRGLGGNVTHSFTVIPAIAGSLPEKAMAALERNPRVVEVELDLPVYAVGYNSGDEYGNTWGVTHIKADLAHQEGYLGSNIKVAVIDSGVDYTHRDLAANFVTGDLGFDFTSCDPETDNPDNEECKPMDVYGHGTHVAGTVAATKDNFGVVGVAPGVQIISLRILNDDGVGSSANTIAALQWIMDYNEGKTGNDRIRITNNSYGRGTESGPVREAFDAAAAAGVLHIAAAGNSGNPAGRGDNVIYPAKYESVVAVSAVDKNNKRPSWSSTGPDVELAAPGVSVLSAWNSDTSYANPQPICFEENSGCHYYKEGSGTSMSSPHVAGTAALVWAINPALNNTDVRQTLRDTAQDLGNSNHYGYGLVRADLAVGAESAPDPDPEPSPEPGDLNIDRFDLTNTSNPAWARMTIDWAVSGENLSKVEIEIKGPAEDYKEYDVSGSEASGSYEFRARGGHGNYQVTLTVTDTSNNTATGTQSITL